MDAVTLEKPDIPTTGTEWILPKSISTSISSSELDTRRGQLIHVVEQLREIQVVIFTAAGELHEVFFGHKSFKDVFEAVHKKIGPGKIQLFHQKCEVAEKDAIGSVVEGEVCELHAFGPLDEERRDDYFRDGRPKSESESDCESEGEIMDGLSLFD